jgi:hypothetical protein
MRLVKFFELPFHLGFLGACMEVGMVLPGETSKGFLDVVGRSVSGDPEDLVIIV